MKTVDCEMCGGAIENGFDTNPTNSDYCESCKEIIRSCEHNCSSNCRREGCNCECGEYHITLRD